MGECWRLWEKEFGSAKAKPPEVQATMDQSSAASKQIGACVACPIGSSLELDDDDDEDDDEDEDDDDVNAAYCCALLRSATY